MIRTRCAVVLLLVVAGCSSTRTSYSYRPDYGVADPRFERSLVALRSAMVAGNRADLLENGDGLFPALLAAVRGASRSVNVELYIFADGRIGRAFADALAERARAGVEVRVLVDSLGARLGPLEERLRAAGVRLRTYKPLRLYSLHRIGHRTHRRLVVVDGRVGFCGGFAVDDRWLGGGRRPEEWRDLTVRLQGPLVTQLQRTFLEDWLHTTGEVLHGDAHFPPLDPAGDADGQVISTSRTDQSSMAKLMLYMAIQAARERIWIENAYFIPDPQLRRGLVDAVRRGVDVRVVVPGRHADIPPIRQASRFHYGQLLEGGVRIYEYRPSMLHTKAVVVDGLWSTVGSINFVNRSMRKNAEANLAFYDRPMAAAIEKVVEADLAASDELTLAEWRDRGVPTRMAELFFWLFSEAY